MANQIITNKIDEKADSKTNIRVSGTLKSTTLKWFPQIVCK